MKNYKASFFDKEFFVRKTGEKGAQRDGDSPHYYSTAVFLFKIFGGKKYTWLDVGCGMGWKVRHLKNLGEDARGFDISKYAVENKITENVEQGDSRTYNKPADIVIAERTLEYLHPDDVLGALKNLWALTGKYMIVMPVCLDAESFMMPYLGAPGRLTLEAKSWWTKKFIEAGMTPDTDKTAILRQPAGWDCLWVFYKGNK